MYTTINFKTKKELKEAVARGETVTIFQPNGDITGFNQPPYNGTKAVEGPHYPEPHKWYAEVEVEDSKVIKVK